MTDSRKSIPVFSMTGFSSVSGTVLGQPTRIELKTLNHRFLELKVRLPSELSNADQLVRAFLQKNIKRGVVECRIEFLKDQGDVQPSFFFNAKLAKSYYQSLMKASADIGISQKLGMEHLLAFPDVISKAADPVRTPQESWDSLKNLVEDGLKSLLSYRKDEGSKLFEVVSSILKDIENRTAHLVDLREKFRAEIEKRISDRVTAVFEKFPTGAKDPYLESRLSQEIALILEKSDIEEELTRLKSHCQHFREILEKGSPLGRKLDFLLQEMNREANTIASKAQDHEMGHEVVDLKVLVEQLREQVMNLE